MNVVITGGCGFIGRNLIASATGRGVRIRVVDDLSAGTTDDLEDLGAVERVAATVERPGWGEAIQVFRSDVRDAGVLHAACEGADAVVHLAAVSGIADSLNDPVANCSSNVLATVSVLEACRQNGVRSCVVASSGAAVGEAPPPMHEEQLPSPVSPYGAAKLAAEAYCRAYRGAFGLSAVALRFSNVYGPHSTHKSSVVARFITAILDGEPPTIYGDGEQTRDFVFAGDLASAIWAAIGAGTTPHAVYQIASGVETSVNRLFALLSDISDARLNRRPRVEYRPRRAGEVARNFADIGRARSELSFAPRMRLADGLAVTFDWFLRARKKDVLSHHA